MNDRYQVVCDRHDPPITLVDIFYDPNQEGNEQRPRMPRPRSSSRKLFIREHPPLFVSQLIDKSGPEDMWEHASWVADLVAEDKPLPHNGYVQAVSFQIGDLEHTDGHEIRIACELCTRTRGKPLLAFASAETLALVLDRIGPDLATVTLPLLDPASEKPTGQTVEVRMLALASLRAELGEKPRG